jgi:phenylalanyl-tRNA synthetase beta chain
MKASYNWLKEFVDFQLPPEELANKLTMAGFEVEALEKVNDDIVFDIGVTPNRPDCLSIRGIAREISAILEIPFQDTSVDIDKEKGKGPIVEIKNPDICPRYSSRIIKGVNPGSSPEWLSKRLESCGIRSTSNIVDVTNYVLLEIGQPMHAFDLDRLAGKKIVVKQAGDLGKFTTLDDEERTLSKEMLLIWDAEKPVAIAGVMGGLNTEVSQSTVNILLESAYFKPSSVRRTSKALNLSTESSYRFERGVDKEAVNLALDKAAQLIAEIAGGEFTCITDEYPVPFEQRTISVSLNKINSFIGADIDESFIRKVLKNLCCETEKKGDLLTVTPPSFREDIERDIDIIEEVARLYGYDMIPSTLPIMQMNAAPEHKRQELIKILKDAMVKSGFSEVINYSFLNPGLLGKLKLSSSDIRRNIIYIRNPLRKEDSAMRTTLIPALINNVSINLNRGEKMLRFFEISTVFLQKGKKLPDEVIQLGAVYHKETTASVWQSKHDGFYDLKGAFENMLLDLKIANLSFSKDSDAAEPYLHPGKSCSILIDDKKIGSIGKIHPGVTDSFDIKGDITIAEIYDIERILNAIPSKTTYVSLPRFPYVERDIALIVNDEVTVSAVMKEILGVDSDIIETVNLFDIYKGKPIPQDKKSLAFSIRYRDVNKTLTDDEVDALHSKIIKRLEKNLKAELRS